MNPQESESKIQSWWEIQSLFSHWRETACRRKLAIKLALQMLVLVLQSLGIDREGLYPQI